MTFKRFKQILKWGWKHAGILSKKDKVGRLRIFMDIIHCYREYRMWSNQYVAENFHLLDKDKRSEIGSRYADKGKLRDSWQADFQDNRRFLVKYSDIKYELDHLREVRNKAYRRRYNAGTGLMVENNVNISRQHYLHGTIRIGKNVLFAKNVFIDYSGTVIIKDGVKFSDGAILESHTHPFFGDPSCDSVIAIPSKVCIEEGVSIGSRAIILDSCSSIGRHARIGAGAVVRNKIPPYAIVVGNPSKIIGFVYTPEQMVDFEGRKYPIEDRISLEYYTKIYNRYFSDRIKEISKFLKN